MVRSSSRRYPHRTLGDLAMNGTELQAVCTRCKHRKLLSLLSLLERFGPTSAAIAVRPHLRCSVCGSMRVVLHEVPGTRN